MSRDLRHLTERLDRLFDAPLLVRLQDGEQVKNPAVHGEADREFQIPTERRAVDPWGLDAIDLCRAEGRWALGEYAAGLMLGR